MIAVCDGDEQCLYDTKAMGSLEIGELTKNAHRYYKFLHQVMKPSKIKRNKINFKKLNKFSY